RCAGTALALTVAVGAFASAQEKSTRDFLAAEIIGPRQSLIDVREYLDARVPRLEKFANADEWDRYAAKLREDVLANVVCGGVARRETQGRMARHHPRRCRLPHQESALRGAAGDVDPRPALRTRGTEGQSAGESGGQRPRLQGQGGSVQADPMHQYGQARYT